MDDQERWGPPIPPEPEPTLLEQALDLLKDYQGTIEELCGQSELYTWLNSEKLVDLQKRLLEIIREYQEQLFKRPVPLDAKQKYFIGMLLAEQCTDGYMATKLGISMEEAKVMIEQYKREEGIEE